MNVAAPVPVEAHITYKSYSQSWRERNRRTRLYASASNEEVLAQFGLTVPPYGSQKGDGSAADLAWAAFNSAELSIMRSKARAWLVENGLGDVKVRFSRTAGCSCPCSPGFVADRVLILNEKPVDAVSI